MNPLIPVLTLRAVGARFSMLRNRAAWRCWGISLALNQPSLVTLTMKSACFTAPPDARPVPLNILATSAGSMSSKQIGVTNRKGRGAGAADAVVVSGGVVGASAGSNWKTVIAFSGPGVRELSSLL